MTYPRSLPPLLLYDSIRTSHPVRVEQLTRLNSAFLTHAWVRAPRQFTHFIEYDRTPPAVQQSPEDIDQTIKVVWKTSATAIYAYIAIRYQATVGSGVVVTNPSIDIDLRDRDNGGAVIDAGYSIEIPDLLWDPASQPWRNPAEWEIRFWDTDLRYVHPGRRPIELPDPGERRVELRLVTTNTRIHSVSVIELPEDIVLGES